jgi:hypothetical protein
MADLTSVTLVTKFCAFLPLLGAVAYFLPKDRKFQPE